MSIKTFNHWVQSGWIFAQTPLTFLAPEDRDFTTVFRTQVQLPTSGSIFPFKIARLTNRGDQGKNGPRRMVKDRPTEHVGVVVRDVKMVVSRTVQWITYDRPVPRRPGQWTSRHRGRAIANEGRAFFEQSSDTDKTFLSHHVQTLTALRDGYLHTRLAQPLVDWFAEESPFGEYFTQPGRMPDYWPEMRQLEKDAAEHAKARRNLYGISTEVEDEFGTEDSGRIEATTPDEEDRWR